MTNKTMPEERKKKLLKNLEKARAAQKKKREDIKTAKAAGTYIEPIKPESKKKRPRNLDKIVREILDDDYLVDKVISNQPEYWERLPSKSGGYIIATVMMVKAMGGDIKAAEWIRKTGFGDKVLLESDTGFFQRDEFTIQVVPAKELDDGIALTEVESDIKQVEEHVS